MPTQGQLCVNSNQPDGHDCKLLADYPRPASKHGFLTARDANKAVETRKASSSSNVEFPMQPHATHAALRNEFNFESELNEVVAGSWRHSRHCHFKNIDGARIFSCSTLLVYVFLVSSSANTLRRFITESVETEVSDENYRTENADVANRLIEVIRIRQKQQRRHAAARRQRHASWPSTVRHSHRSG